MENIRKRLDNALRQYLTPAVDESHEARVLYDAMEYSVFSGGKRLRPMLMLNTCHALGGFMERAMPFACAIELIHTYSLIHDDLPALDNDDFRRGLPTNHVRFGEDMAILAGDGLLNLAMEIMTDACASDHSLIKAMKIITNAAGHRGMIGGQVVDVVTEGKSINEETLLFIHNHKTGAILKASILAGAAIANFSAPYLDELGQKLGLAFQIMDDILDASGDFEKLGKPIHSDLKNKKNTFVTFYGLDKAKEIYFGLSNDVKSLLTNNKLQDTELFSQINDLTHRVR